LQRIGRQYCRGLIELPVDRGFAAAQVVVVHRREIIMHQRKRMDEFDRRGRRIEPGFRDAKALASCVDPQWPYTFAAIEYRVPHRFVKALRRLPGVRQDTSKHVGDAVAVIRNSVCEVSGHSNVSAGGELRSVHVFVPQGAFVAGL
jgi:hypothetical protein